MILRMVNGVVTAEVFDNEPTDESDGPVTPGTGTLVRVTPTRTRGALDMTATETEAKRVRDSTDSRDRGAVLRRQR